jgi:type IV pilus assembly protein PilE
MRRISGMTLIELMMVVAIVALLAAVALPSYQRYLARGIRSQAQQFLMDIAQAQEQFFLDQRSYATDLGVGPGLLNRTVPPEVAKHYTLTQPIAVNNVATPPTFMLVLTPLATDNTVGAAAPVPDGALILNNLQQRWREVDGNLIYNPQPADCTWEATNCVAH